MHSLEAQADCASRDKDVAVDALAALRKENDVLVLQNSRWEDIRRTNEQLERLATLISQAQINEPELRELRRVRDLSLDLEGEYAALQRRYNEQETRVTLSECAVNTALADLAQAQQRAAEWEQRAKESVVALIEARAMCDQAEDRAAQLELEHALVRMQLEKKDTRTTSQGYGSFVSRCTNCY